VADVAFEHPRLAGIYDALDPDRRDLGVYVCVAEEFGARRVLDVGCGTGTFALLLAAAGIDVTGVDPAAGSLDVARAKPGAERVRWIHGTAATLPQMQVDLATMTGNVAQAVVDHADWEATLRGVYEALRPGGRLVFETRDPARRQWDEWNGAASLTTTDIPGVGTVESWHDVVGVRGALVTLRATYVFTSDGAVLTSRTSGTPPTGPAASSSSSPGAPRRNRPGVSWHRRQTGQGACSSVSRPAGRPRDCSARRLAFRVLGHLGIAGPVIGGHRIAAPLRVVPALTRQLPRARLRHTLMRFSQQM